MEEIGFLGESNWFLGKMNGPSEDMLVCDEVCLSVVPTSSLLSYDKSQSFLVDKIPWGRGYDSWAPFGQYAFRLMRVQENLSLHLLFFKRLQLKKINIQKQHISGQHVLNSYGHILGGIFCDPSLEWYYKR